MTKKVVVLGGGVGGVVAAKRLAERTKGRADVEITLISDVDYYLLPPLLVNIALGDISPSQAQIPLSKFSAKNVKVVKASVAKVDPDNRAVETTAGKFSYDYLIASLGTSFDFASYNLGAGNHNFTLDGALKLKEALGSFKGGNVVIYTPEPVYRCGVYPFEIAAQLDTIFRKRGIRDKVDITLIHPFKRPIEPLGPEAIKITEEAFAAKGIRYVGGAQPGPVDDKEKVVTAGGERFKYDLLIVVPPSRLPKPFEGTPLVAQFPNGTWTAINVYTGRSLKYDDVYLPGEHSMPAIGLPTAGVPVHFTAMASANMVAGELLGQPIDLAQINAMTCAMDYGDFGMMFNCDIKLNLKDNKAAWMGNCYSVLTSPLGRLIKDLFYKTWLATTI